MKIVGPYTSPTIYSENPGTVELTSSDPSVATVDASVVIPGTRVWGNMGSGGDYLARVSSAGNSRSDCTIGFEVDLDRLVAYMNTAVTLAYPLIPIFGSIRTDATRRANWLVCLRRPVPNGVGIVYIQSADASTAEAAIAATTSTFFPLSGVTRFAVKLFDAGVSNTVAFYTGAAGNVGTASRVATVGTMGGSEALVLWAGSKAVKWARQLSTDDLNTWFSGGMPATPELAYLGGHEINPAAPVIYDTSGNVTPLDLTATQITNWQAPGMSGDYTDDPLDPVIPFQPFTITPNSTGTFTITARRRRQGVPDRASDGEKYETTSETFTITEMPAEVVQYVRLLITTSTPGTVDIASSDPSVVTFPSSVAVGPTLQYEVLGTVVGAGTSTITTSMGGAVLDTTTVTIEDTPTVIEAGPPQNLRARI